MEYSLLDFDRYLKKLENKDNEIDLIVKLYKHLEKRYDPNKHKIINTLIRIFDVFIIILSIYIIINLNKHNLIFNLNITSIIFIVSIIINFFYLRNNINTRKILKENLSILEIDETSLYIVNGYINKIRAS